MTRKIVLACFAVAALLAVSGCVTQPVPSDRDAAALKRLGEIAGPTSVVSPGAITRTECWLPSRHPIESGVDSDTLWRVLCRVHYRDEAGDRYQDTTCIGDFAADPMLDHCYRWTHYDFTDEFEDHEAVNAG